MHTLSSNNLASANLKQHVTTTKPVFEGGLEIREAACPAQWNADVVLEAWRRLLDSSDNPNAMYQSPEWLTHLARNPETQHRLRVVTVHSNCGQIVALLPLLKNQLQLDISVSGRTLLRNRLQVEELLGYEPLATKDPTVLSYVARYIVHEAERAIHIRMLRHNSTFYLELVKAASESKSARMYDFSGTSCRHLVRLAPNFREYLSKFSTKKRYNLKRQVQQLRDASGGALSLREFSTPEDVSTFLEDAAPVASSSWQCRVSDDVIAASDRWQEELSAIASKGMLRSFILYSGNQACAFVLGVQHEDVFHFDATGYDPQFHAWSPGTAILYLMIEHLISDAKGVRRISLGFGDQEYKRVFGNERISTIELLLYRQSFVTTPKIALHRGYRSGISVMRNLVRGFRR